MLIKPLYFHYLTGFIGFFVIVFIISILEFSLENVSYFIVGYIWNFSITSPNLKEMVSTKRYKFSFMRFVYNYNKYFSNINILSFVKYRFIITSLSSIPICFLVYLISQKGYPFLCFFGGLLFELFYYVFLKIREITL